MKSILLITFILFPSLKLAFAAPQTPWEAVNKDSLAGSGDLEISDVIGGFPSFPATKDNEIVEIAQEKCKSPYYCDNPSYPRCCQVVRFQPPVCCPDTGEICYAVQIEWDCVPASF